MLENYTTADYAIDERMPFWSGIASEMLAPLTVDAADLASFEGAIVRRRFADFELIAARSTPASVVRYPEDKACLLQIQTHGRSMNWTGDRHCSLEVGDFVILDSQDVVNTRFEVEQAVLILRLDTATMRDRLPHVRDLVGRRIAGGSGPGAPFSTFLRSLWGEIRSRDGDWVDALGEVIWPMLTMACADPGEAAPRARQHERERDTIRALIERRLDEPDLGPRMIAKEAGYSVRFVQLLFAEQGTTPTAYIRGRRLQRAADILATSQQRVSITALALDVGFNDLSTFCRDFRRQFGIAPSRYREAQRV
ncbi:AraC family transcriptional regulator [Sphingomonas sp. MMS24-J13]|uniref:AraC family transcriptional regulator n=1 Tax=Sphingomonas sp. MMS24-J13 TaxID=3238686 RepID=UPI00384F883F